MNFCVFEGRLTQNHRKKDVPECEHINRFTHVGLLVVDFRGIVELCAVVVIIFEPVLLFLNRFYPTKVYNFHPSIDVRKLECAINHDVLKL